MKDSREGGPGRLDPAKWQQAPPNRLHRVRKVSQLFPAFYLPPQRRCSGDLMGSHPCIQSAQSCLSFPNGPKPQDSDFQGDVSRRKKWTKRTGRGKGLEEFGALLLFGAPVAAHPLPHLASEPPR